MNPHKLLVVVFCAVGALLAAGCANTESGGKIDPAMKARVTDPNVLYGKLENGLTYYIRHNEYPKERASFYIAQRVGAVQEEDSQNGLAHFLEHMAFNGSKNFPGKEMLNYLQLQGVEYGRNINAYTGLDQTVYNLDEVPTMRKEVVDSALLILHDWSGCISLEDAEIDNERGVITEEWRTRNSGANRIWKRHNAKINIGTPYAVRDVIGDTAVIKNFSYKTLRDYYHKWYRPDLQGIIIVGDIDPQYILGKIKEYWADIPAQENPAERVYYAIPLVGDKTMVSVETDSESQYNLIELEFRMNASPQKQKLTDKYYEDEVRGAVATYIASMRLQEICNREDEPLAQAGCGYGYVSPLTLALSYQALPKVGRMADATQTLFDEMEKLRRWGVTNSEFELSKKNFLKNVEDAYNSRATRQTSSFVNEYVNSFLEFKPCEGIETEYEKVKKVVAAMTKQEVDECFKLYQNAVITLTGTPTEVTQSEEEVLAVFNGLAKRNLKPYEDVSYDSPLVRQEPQSGKIEKEESSVMGSTRLELSNGAVVYMLPTEYNKNEVSFSAFSRGGIYMLDLKDALTAGYAAGVMDACGWGEYSSVALQKVLSGKSVSLSPYIVSQSEGLSGQCASGDLGTLLQLAYLQFTAPREDRDAFNSAMMRYRTSLESRVKVPSAQFSDTISKYITEPNPYVQRLTLDNINGITLEDAMRIYKDRFANSGDFTFTLVGDFTIDAAKPLIEKWIASLPANGNKEDYVLRDVRDVRGSKDKSFKFPMEVKKTQSFTMYSGVTKEYDRKFDKTLGLLVEILNLRYDETVREEEGGTYGVGVSGGQSNSKTSADGYAWNLYIEFTTDPEKFPTLYPIIRREIEKIAKEGPTANDLKKVKDTDIKNRAENRTQNWWWANILDLYIQYGIDFSEGGDELTASITAADIKAAAKMVLATPNIFKVNMNPAD